MPPELIVIDSSESEDKKSLGARQLSKTALGKRKAEPVPPPIETIPWTDSEEEAEKERTRKRRAKERRSAKKKRSARPEPGSISNNQGSRSARSLAEAIRGLGEDAAPEDKVHADIPQYLKDRKRQFNRDRATLQEAGLLLPPDYTDLDFTDDEDNGRRREVRPQFGDRIKPCRPYEDIELERSAGIIPAPIAQYLRDYQVDGVAFLHEAFVYQRGCILGDDMGLGKTVQVAAFLTAAFGKTGDFRDSKRMRKVKRLGRRYYKVLIVCPSSVMENWRQELARWGWWKVESYHGFGKDDVLDTAKSGRLEVMLTTPATYRLQKERVNTVSWDAVVVDECHNIKERRSEITKAMTEVNALCRIGLTGTAIQNKYEELWTLLNWTNPGRFGTFGEWTTSISRPLTLGQSHNATLQELSMARKTARKLVQNLLPDYFLRRMKSLIAHQLPKKRDRVIFCPLTDLQTAAYERFIASEEVELVRRSDEPCDCGSGEKRGHCHYARLSDGRTWNRLVFPCILTLQNLANHLTLIVPKIGEPGDKAEKHLARLRICVPDKWEQLYKLRDSPLIQMDPEFCGKWRVLKDLLKFWEANGDKVLVFSHSVKLLQVLRALFQTTHYSYSYLDGSLAIEERQQVVDDFNSDPQQFVFLISTKAGGVGLNITSANKVVIFDPHWNPSWDLQAQDRAYRIGQTRDVDVFRLVSQGTIEEIVYARQIYKQQQANIGYNASSERRYFTGVQQDNSRKGEIFGLENIFTFRPDRVVLRDIVNKTNVAEAKVGVYLQDIDIESAIKDSEEAGIPIKLEPGASGDAEERGASQLADFLTSKTHIKSGGENQQLSSAHDAIQAILSSAGVGYTHDNAEVVGTSKVEAQLSRKAERDHEIDEKEALKVLFADSQDVDANSLYKHDREAWDVDEMGEGDDWQSKRPETWFRPRLRYNPPQDVRLRQFCSMAKEFGFSNAIDFALVVESWTQEQRRNCLDIFYKRRESELLKTTLAGEAKKLVKNEPEVKTDSASARIKTEVLEENGMIGIEEFQTKSEVPIKTEAGVADSKVKMAPMNDETESDPDDCDAVKVKDEDMSKIEREPGLVTTKRQSAIFLFDDDDEDDEL
ncbi:hypothetical protein PpBr36_07423 [Pyricularia pennisetigena]|uniref:hypothetical protein n=1 Tax=Pyricularia pennisetigena TaxID=1578925 RepID=UPI00114D4F9A|nr:hypothetical protein PpBr36_07423 [Pyricularia pennisetigena]TLS25690.1 hypothetical protein PpBr36_07423 [Pyricularia pennisetigena]